ncbi:hypothetical protein HYFRA_00013349 [Hymenoscyphus fraxineus]|uniref:Uncharacterized protein n=1 Tax=Hymenoscyphus fraxineus TaxID=746836 RepID=A0A9N9PVI7_9HELO|nr:hypothetical protein HYFRA_00013349 [Hymenoscyphus fraxineus]
MKLNSIPLSLSRPYIRNKKTGNGEISLSSMDMDRKSETETETETENLIPLSVSFGTVPPIYRVKMSGKLETWDCRRESEE